MKDKNNYKYGSVPKENDWKALAIKASSENAQHKAQATMFADTCVYLRKELNRKSWQSYITLALLVILVVVETAVILFALHTTEQQQDLNSAIETQFVATTDNPQQ